MNGYIKQKHDWDCGPVAISNVLNFLKIKKPSIKTITKRLGTNKRGTSDTRFEPVLQKLIGHNSMWVWDMEDGEREAKYLIDCLNWCRDSAIAVVGHLDCEGEWHYSTWRHTGELLISYNIDKDEPVVNAHDPEVFFKILTTPDLDGEYPLAYYIRG